MRKVCSDCDAKLIKSNKVIAKETSSGAVIYQPRCHTCHKKYSAKRAKRLRQEVRKEERLAMNKELITEGKKVCKVCLKIRVFSEYGTSMPNGGGKVNKICDNCLTKYYYNREDVFSPEYWRRRAYACNTTAKNRLSRVARKPITLKDLGYVCKPQHLAEMFSAQKGACVYCSVKLSPRGGVRASIPDALTVDHRTPLSVGGAHQRNNLVLCCMACNQLKGTMDVSTFMQFLRDYAERVLIALEVQDKELER